MKNMTIKEFCDRFAVCRDGRDWALATGCATMAELWEREDLRTEWRLWVATREGMFSDRDLRLFACWCVRQVWPLLADKRSKHAVEVSEKFAVGDATAEEMDAAWAAAWAASDAARDAARDAASAAAWAASAAAWAATYASYAARDAARDAASAAAWAASDAAWAATYASYAARDAARAAAGAAYAASAARDAASAASAAQSAKLKSMGNPFQEVAE
jgi:hypothetical protein